MIAKSLLSGCYVVSMGLLYGCYLVATWLKEVAWWLLSDV